MPGFVAGEVLTASNLNAAHVAKRVRVATVAAGTLSTSFENGDTVDGVSLTTGDRILIKDQASGADNGIYVVAASGSPTRAVDFDASAEVLSNTLVVVAEGTSNKDSVWQLTNNATITVGSTALVFFPIHMQGTGSPESAVTAPVGAVYKRTDGGTSTTLYVKESGTGNTGWAAVGAASAALLASVQYASTANYTTTSGTFADVDATNLVLTFTVPASGNVILVQTAFCDVTAGSLTQTWNVRAGAADVSGSTSDVIYSGSATPYQNRLSNRVKITGLTPGASLTWKWGWKSSGSTSRMFAASNEPILMEVWSA